MRDNFNGNTTARGSNIAGVIQSGLLELLYQAPRQTNQYCEPAGDNFPRCLINLSAPRNSKGTKDHYDRTNRCHNEGNGLGVRC